MNTEDLKSLQAPFKERFKSNPEAALITLRARAHATDALSCQVVTGKGLVEAGLHPPTGGNGSLACAGVTLTAVATAIGREPS